MLKIHSLPETEQKSEIYSIKVNNIPVIAEFARVSSMPFNTPWPDHQRELSQTEESAFISFESNEKVILEVTSKEKIEKVFIRPLSKEVEFEMISEYTVKFELSKFGGYVLEINGLHSPLHIFFNPLRDFASEAEKAAQKGRRVHYFGKGVHNIGDLELESHSTVTIDAGAIVYGNISAFSAEDIIINGYGVIDGSFEIRDNKDYKRLLIPVFGNSTYWASAKYNPENPYFVNDKKQFDDFMEETKCLKGLLRFYFCNNVKCEGVIMRDSSTFCAVPAACDNVIFDNIKTIGMWRYNSDGIDIFNSSNVTVKNCFLRNFDDVMVIKGIVGWDFKNNEDITVDNCVLWCDWGAACEIGAETNAPEYKNITFKNCDILYDSAGAMMRIHHHNRANIHHIKYENMHCEFHSDQMNSELQTDDKQIYEYKEGSYQPGIINVVVTNQFIYGVDNLKGCIHDVEFNNIHLYLEEGITVMPRISVFGFNEKCFVDNVCFSNIFLNGKKIENYDDLNIEIKDFAFNINFK